MRRKSESELELIRESGRWCSRGHRLLQDYSVPGATEAEASGRAGYEATLELYRALGDDIGQQGSSDGVKAGYRGQIGLRSAWAHAVAHNIEFKAGDILVTETGAPIWGYNAELERAMVIGPASDEVRRLFDHTVAMQQVAFDAFRPGVTCADVDGAVMKYLEDNSLLPYWRQHTGHGIGLRNHEAPFLDVGDHTPVEPGMVFTIEPGLYSDELGGFRHSDTIAVRRRRDRDPHRVSPGSREPHDSGLTTVARATRGSVKTSSSSRLVVENSLTIAPSSPAWNQCSVSGGIRN